jgi:hypothetical protein
MGTTPAGFPYPEPTDDLRDGAAAIQALAEAVPWVQVGEVTTSYTSLQPSNHTTVALTFPEAFPEVPPFVNATKRVVVAGSGKVIVSAVQNVTATGASIVLTNFGTIAETATGVRIQWVAIGAQASA